MSSDKLSVVVFSGTSDKLQAVATIAAAAAAMGTDTHLFLTFWGLNAFRKDVEADEPPMAEHAGHEAQLLAKFLANNQPGAWCELLRSAREVGSLRVHACAATMDMAGLSKDDLDPMVEDVIGAATFLEIAKDGQILFV